MKYRIIIAGSRTFDNKQLLYNIISSHILHLYLDFEYNERCVIEIISGKARGADTLGEQFARSIGYKVAEFPANWDKYGKSAGCIRNREMAEYAAKADKGILFAFWDGESPGTKNMIEVAKQFGLEVFVYKF